MSCINVWTYVIIYNDVETPVTIKSFMDWRNRFDAEMKELRSKSKLTTGRQIFEKAKNIGELEVEEAEDAGTTLGSSYIRI